MKNKHIAFVLLWFFSIKLTAQQLTYVPDIVIGHRSSTYLHNVNYQFNSKIRVNNLTLFDTEYKEYKNNIFFIRNTLSYNIPKKISLNAEKKKKNPGSFFTISAQYRMLKPTYSFAYSIGTTYQKGFTLEQSISIEYYPTLTENLQLYFNFLAIANVNLEEYQRGLQFIRLGLKEKKVSYGLFLNLDQFNNNIKTLENAGTFIKYQF